MPRGGKSTYTTKQKRQARHIEEGYKKRGVKVNRAPAARSASARKAAATRVANHDF
jgi:hypothetical protein